MLTLWLDSYALEFTGEGCGQIIAALDRAEDRVVSFLLDQAHYKRRKANKKPGFQFCYKGKRWSVPKADLKDLRSKCAHVRDGGQAEFELGVRFENVTVEKGGPL